MTQNSTPSTATNTATNTAIETDAERLIVEQVRGIFRDLKSIAHNAPDGQVLNQVEAATMIAMRKLTQKTLEVTLQEEVSEREKKKEVRECPKCQQKMRHRGYEKKTVVTAAGEVVIRRFHCECVPCKNPSYPADTRLGLIKTRYSLGARSMAVFAGANWSFDKSSQFLKEFCGLDISDNTIRELCQQEALKMEKWHRTDEGVSKEFSESHGEVEFMTDGTCVNTMDGWRVMNVATFSKRELAKPALPDEWDTRHLPKPHVLWSFAEIASFDSFRCHWKHRANWLGVDKYQLSAVADGAHCIWEAVPLEFGKVRETLDIYHALENISDCGKELYDAKSSEFKVWRDATTLELLWYGYDQLEPRLVRLGEDASLSAAKKEAIRKLRGYLDYHRGRLNYRERLWSGLSIGSGQIEGACKNLVGRRLKQTGARWCVERVNRMATLCSVLYCDNWRKYWQTAT